LARLGLATSKDESRKIFDGFAEAGGNFIDTANKYNEGKSESLLGEFIEADRDHFVVATKYTLSTREGDPNACGNHRKNMARALEASLKRLNTDYIDLYWVHAWDFMTPVEEVMRGLDDMVRAGKVLFLGISDAPAWIVAHANTLAQVHGWSPFVGLQIEYSLAQRDPERDLIPMARAFDIGVTRGVRWPAEFSAASMRRQPRPNPKLLAMPKAIRRMNGSCASEKR
jgi:aryl-alcohol dehydrogenase-like predicted oxidoreductase